MKLSCIIVEDEEGSQYVLQKYMERLDYAEVSASFFNAIDALAYLRTNKTDVILLDINMPEQDGFALLDQLENKSIVIFTTAYSQYAMKAFEYNAIDYLYKPIHFERFSAAMEKARIWNNLLTQTRDTEQIQIRSDGRIVSLETTHIVYIESLGNYIKIHTPLKNYMALMTLNELEQVLPIKKFARIHKSYVINMDFITAITATDVHINEKNLPIGRTFKKLFLMKMGR